MRPELRRIGQGQSPIVVIDEFSGDSERIARIAEGLAPFPEVTDEYYPGVRRVIRENESEPWAYVTRTCETAAQFLAGAFDIEGFKLLRGSFSIVTRTPDQLSGPQRAPHFDSTDPKYFALLHYLRVPEGSGTAFYRQRSTGIERVTEINVARFMSTFERESAFSEPRSGYISGSDQCFEQIGTVEAVPDRLVIYQGSLLHSGIIPSGMSFSSDPKEGRLTANLFLLGH